MIHADTAVASYFFRTGLFFFKYLEKSAQVQKFSHATGIAIIVARRAQVFEAIFPSVCPAFVFKVHHYSNIWEHSASKLVDFAMNEIVGFQNNKTKQKPSSLKYTSWR